MSEVTPDSPGELVAVFHGAYCERRHRRISVIEPPSPYMGRPGAELNLSPLEFNPDGLAYDCASDLLVVGEKQ